MNKCCVCNQETKDTQEFKSVFDKHKINTYCFNCLVSGFEPYEDLVNYGWEYLMFNKTFRKKIVLPTLSLNGKTVEQFNEDVIKKRDEKNASRQ